MCTLDISDLKILTKSNLNVTWSNAFAIIVPQENRFYSNAQVIPYFMTDRKIIEDLLLMLRDGLEHGKMETRKKVKNNTHDGRQAAAKQKSNTTINQTIFISAECRRRLVALVASAIDTHTLGETRRARVCHAVLPLTQCVCVSLCIVW